MANRVTKSTLFSESRNNVVALIKANVTDTLLGSAEYRKWIYSREPDVKSSDFKDYPFIVVSPSEPIILPARRSLDGKSKMVAWSIAVDIVTSDRGYGNKDGQGMSQIDSIGDSIMEVFNDITHRTTLSNNSMKFSTPVSGGFTEEPIADELTYRRTILLNFTSKIQVSS